MISTLLIRLVANGLALYIAAQIIPGVTYDNRLSTLLVATVLLAIVNSIVLPLLKLLALPLIIFTLGLISLVINAFLLWGVVAIVDGYTIVGVWPLIGTLVIIWLTNALIDTTRK